MEQKTSKLLSALILGGAISIGLLGAGFFIGKGVYTAKATERYVTVKGLAERQVKSNLGVWEIDFREVGNNLVDLSTQLDKDQKAVVAFLQNQGFKTSEIELRATKVNDQLANLYGGSTNTSTTSQTLQYRYTLLGGVRVQSNNVDLIQKATQSTGALITQGLALSFDTPDLNPNPSYFFNQLDQVRPAMLSDATRSARLIAEQFAANSGSKVGGIRRASQGMFQLMGRDISSEDNNWQNSQNQLSSIYKKIRLVTTIDYLLKH